MNEEEKKAINFLKENMLDYEEIDTSILLDINLTHKTILNLIEKLQKENEELKQDRNNNYQMIALAQNEILGYIQGYEDGKKSKKSAVAFAVENQEYYLIRKEIEHYKERIEELQKENEESKEIYRSEKKMKNEYIKLYQDLLLKENVIPVQKVKDKIKEEKMPLTIVGGIRNKKILGYGISLGRMQVLQELIEEREEK